jgi:hypothetical protein
MAWDLAEWSGVQLRLDGDEQRKLARMLNDAANAIDEQLEAVAEIEDEEAAHQDTSGLLRRVSAQRDALAEALLDTREGDDKDDGKPCWCSSPSYARAHGGIHSPRCVKCRSALDPMGRED